MEIPPSSHQSSSSISSRKEKDNSASLSFPSISDSALLHDIDSLERQLGHVKAEKEKQQTEGAAVGAAGAGAFEGGEPTYDAGGEVAQTYETVPADFNGGTVSGGGGGWDAAVAPAADQWATAAPVDTGAVASWGTGGF